MMRGGRKKGNINQSHFIYLSHLPAKVSNLNYIWRKADNVPELAIFSTSDFPFMGWEEVVRAIDQIGMKAV